MSQASAAGVVGAEPPDPRLGTTLSDRYRVTRKYDGALIATGHTRQAIVNEKGFLVYELPEALAPKVLALAAAHGSKVEKD